MGTQHDIQVLPATAADYPVVRNLSSYYIYDFTEYMGWQCPESGYFGGCDELFEEWQTGKNYPYLLRVGGELAGFAGVGLDETTREFHIEEFFVLRKFRRQGVGKAFACHLLDQFAGKWRIEQLVDNTPAVLFWLPTIQDYAGTQSLTVEERDSAWGRVRTLRFYRPVPEDITNYELPRFRDGALELHLNQATPPHPEREWLPIYDFTMRVDGQPAGNINLRVGNTYSILMYGGHIGYGVFPQFRGHHFAERACRLLVPLARAHGLQTIWITTNPENAASRRTCERLGASLVGIVPLPEDHDLYSGGDREKCRYRIDLTGVPCE